MKKILFGALASLLLLASCTKDRVTGSGPIITQDRTTSAFTKVSTSGSTDVHIIQGNAFKVQVKGYENLVAYMEAKVNGHTLDIGYGNGVSVRNDNVEVYVTLPLLESVTTSGSGNTDAKGIFTGAGLSTSLSGSGSIAIESGDVPLFQSSVSGSGNIRAFGLTAQKAEASISGSGSTEVKAVSNLKVNISGSGTVYYKGQPVLETSVSGSGKVVHK